MSEQCIFDLYRSLELWTNPICTQCRSSVQPSLFGPIGIWQVGRSYFDDPHRLVFVGKNARGSLRDDVESELSQRGFIDGTTAADQMIGEKWGAYWNYTAEIITR